MIPEGTLDETLKQIERDSIRSVMDTSDRPTKGCGDRVYILLKGRMTFSVSRVCDTDVTLRT